VVRARAEALFPGGTLAGGAGAPGVPLREDQEDREEVPAPSKVPGAASAQGLLLREERAGRPEVPGAPPAARGPVGRLRTWLFVRCGLEFRTVIALAVVLAVGGGLAVQHYWAGRPRTVQMPPVATGRPITEPPRAASTPAAKPRLTIDVSGKVARPGLRRLPAGSRVADALTAAGGPLPGTDTTSLNLARPLTDGEQLLVGITPPPGAPPPDPASAPDSTTPLSLSSATAPQLDALPGVGPVLAQHIIDFRTRHGGFTSLTQLRQVPGIGPAKFATLQPLVHP
jgi:competence protein ComEA